jgi:hypothetical protein
MQIKQFIERIVGGDIDQERKMSRHTECTYLRRNRKTDPIIIGRAETHHSCTPLSPLLATNPFDLLLTGICVLLCIAVLYLLFLTILFLLFIVIFLLLFLIVIYLTATFLFIVLLLILHVVAFLE